MKVLFITCHPSLKGGISSWVRLIQEYNQKHKLIDDLYMYPSYDGKTEFAQDRTLFQRVFGGAITIFKSAAKLNKIIKENEDIDVIHLTTSAQLALFRDIVLLKIARKHKIPTILHLHFGRFKDISHRNTLEFKILKKAIELSNITITIDEASYNSAKAKLPTERIVNVPNPVNVSAMVNLLQTAQNKTITFLGWVIKTKGIEELLAAWAEIRKEYSEYNLKIIGPYTEEYITQIKQNFDITRVELCGEMQHGDAMQEIKNSAIFILPSYTEGFPIVVVEAMALGKPVIATEVGAVPEMLADGCGAIIRPKCINDIVVALKDLLDNNDKCNVYAQNAQAKAINEYSSDKVYNNLFKIWQQCKANK